MKYSQNAAIRNLLSILAWLGSVTDQRSSEARDNSETTGERILVDTREGSHGEDQSPAMGITV